MKTKMLVANVFSAGTEIDTSVTPAYKGAGNRNYICAGCDATMLEGMEPGGVQHMIFKCPHCGTRSALPNGTT